jgi:hypothetical protein
LIISLYAGAMTLRDIHRTVNDAMVINRHLRFQFHDRS